MTKPPLPQNDAQPRPQTRSRSGAKPAAPSAHKGERIAKVLSRAGLASRREAEAMVEAGRVQVNGKRIDSPALNVSPGDKVLVDGKPLAAPEPARLWLYHKPQGLVTTARDEKGRETVFDALPEDMPRVMSVGRLDISSEGLLLLTNDGELKRKLELPSTGWLRKYRVRVNGTPEEKMLEPLRKGIVLEGERFQPMAVAIDRQQGANAWLTVGIREGRNREVRRAMEAVGLAVNRLIRISYGPFQLGDLAAGAVEEVRSKVLRDQLGGSPDAEAGAETGARPVRKPAPDRAKPASTPAPKRATRNAPAKNAPERNAPERHAPEKGAARGGAGGGAKNSAPRNSAAKNHTPRTGAADPASTAEKPARRSWGSKSFGGKKGAGDSDAKPRSWGTKRAQPGSAPTRAPRKPSGPGR